MAFSQRRPRLAPGLRVVSRGPDHVQIGLYDDRSVLLSRADAVERTLASLLEGPGAVPALGQDPASAAVLDRLDRNGCLVWDPPIRRECPRVAVLGRLAVPGLPDVAGLPDVGELLGAGGAAITSSILRAEVVLVLSAGELDRDLLDPLIRRRTTHLAVRLVDGGAVLGPFVVPGVTACLRCVDAHLSVRDPHHVVVTSRYVRATARARPDGTPDLDPALTSVALAWAARDVLAHLAGDEPSTWSRTVHLGPAPTRHLEQRWLRHPKCGCGWPVEVFPPENRPA